MAVLKRAKSASRSARGAGERSGGAGASDGPGRAASATRLREIRAALELNQAGMARVLGVSVRTLSELENGDQPARPETHRRITEVARLHRALSEIVSKRELPGWMERPNVAFDGASPLHLIERGEIDRLWEMVYELRTGHPG